MKKSLLLTDSCLSGKILTEQPPAESRWLFSSEEKYGSFPPDIQKALADAGDSAREIFTHNVTLLEKKNEKSNLGRYGAAYLKVTYFPGELKYWRYEKR